MGDANIRVGELPGVALVTGAASGMGQSISLAFAAAGCQKIALCDVNETGLEETRNLILKAEAANASQLQIRCYGVDVSKAESVSSAFAKVHSDFGSIDYAVNCAGITSNWQSSTDTDVEVWDQISSVNYRGVWLCSREELKYMKDQPLESPLNAGLPDFRTQRGAIVNISSSLALASMPNSPAYCAAKAGVVGITRADALDYSAHKIRVNAVLPGIMLTPMTNIPGLKEAIEETTVKLATPLKRWGQPEEVADVCVFLCSTKASFVQGAAWTVDGGFIIQ